MSKTKEYLLREQDQSLEYYSMFYDWLDSLKLKELSELDINRLEREQSPLSVSKSIIAKSTNNQDYKLGEKYENY